MDILIIKYDKILQILHLTEAPIGYKTLLRKMILKLRIHPETKYKVGVEAMRFIAYFL